MKHNYTKLIFRITSLCFLIISTNIITAQGFGTSPINWSLPSGGKVLSGHNYGFNGLADAGSYDASNQGWSVLDINGDGKMDLIVTCEGNGTNRDCFGVPTSQYWNVYLGNGMGFSNSPTVWALPNGGKVLSGHVYGFSGIADAGSYDASNQGWSVMDMNGDNKPDLVVTCEGNGTNRDCFGVPTSQYWNVYLNTGTGFSNSATVWTLPNGGKVLSGHVYGFSGIADAGSYDASNQGWSVTDMNGDDKPDLVVTCEGNGTNRDCFGVPTSQYWNVYLNTGTGFSTSPIVWTLPNGGKVLSGHVYGFSGMADAGSYDVSNQGWSVTDMNGDSKPDLVVTCEGTGTNRDCFGVPTSQYWNVYLNTGTGFSTSPTVWVLPNGGKVLSGHTYGFNGIADAGTYDTSNQGWSLMDLDGDGKTDLIVSSQGNGTYKDCFGVPTSQYWNVYLNNGSGFSTSPTVWLLPNGGKVLSGHTYGFNGIADAGTYDLSNQGWSVMDINGDTKADLIVTCEGTGTYKDGFGLPSSPFWKVFTNLSLVNVSNHSIEQNAFSIYPNPTSDNIFVLKESSDDILFTISDNLGKEVLSGKLNSEKTEIKINQLPQGIYFLKTYGIEPAVKKIIKQ